jgi:hypothetical protein
MRLLILSTLPSIPVQLSADRGEVQNKRISIAKDVKDLWPIFKTPNFIKPPFRIMPKVLK